MYLAVTLIYLAVALVSILLFSYTVPSKYFMVYPFIYVFFWFCGIALTYFLDRARKRGADKLTGIYMLFRMIRLLALLIILMIGIKVMDLERAPFIVALMSSYLIYSVLEIYIFYRFNKRINERCGSGKK